MINQIRAFLFGELAIEFETDFDLEEAISRLSKEVKRSVFGALTKQEMVGHVSRNRVTIQRGIPFIGNSFKPFFIGSFEEVEGVVFLRGAFRMHRFTQVFMTFWFGFCMLWIVMAITSPAPEIRFMPLDGLVMIGFGVGLVQFGKWLSRNDVAWITKRVENVLAYHA